MTCLLHDLQAAFDTDREGLEATMQVLILFAGKPVYISPVLLRRMRYVEAAISMIRSDMSFRQIPATLAARFGISKSTARRVRDFALGEMQRQQARKQQRAISKELADIPETVPSPVSNQLAFAFHVPGHASHGGAV